MMEIESAKKLIVHSFIKSFISHTNTSSCLLLAHSEHKIYEGCDIEGVTINHSNEKLPLPEKFDLILGDFPFGKRSHHSFDNPEIKHDSAISLLNSLDCLADGGFGIYTLEPMFISGIASTKLKEAIRHKGFSIVGYVNLPERFLDSYSSLQPLFLIVSKNKFTDDFIGDLQSSEQSSNLAVAFLNRLSGKNIHEGLLISGGTFEGFARWEISQQIKHLDSEYKNFKSYRLETIAIAINSCSTGESFTEILNSIYVPKIGSQQVVSDIEQTVIKHQNYFQVVCDPEFVSADYLSVFFQSRLGRLILQSLYSDSFIRSISKTVLMKAVLPIPDLKSQYEIVESLRKLKLITLKVSSFEESLARNPISSNHVLDQIDKVLDAVGELADTDRIRSLLREGESKSVEFKETFSLDVRKQTKEKDIRASSIKTIAAFLNSDGGVLLIGVNDAGVITGLDTEIEKFHKADNIHKSRDKFLLDFKNALKHQIGEQFYTFINHRFVNVDSQIVLFVECQASPMAVYVDNKDFFVRTNPSTDQLEGPKLVAYIQNHFKN
jgi:hypothetical protein